MSKVDAIKMVLHDIKMNQKVLIFDDQCINKYSFYKNKKPINIDEVEIEGKVLSRVESYRNKGSY